jgi:hypothetical protein
VAELPESYGPPVPTIVFQTSKALHECPTTLKVCQVSSGNLNHPRFDFRAGSITVALQYYNNCTNIQIYYIRVQRKSYNNISLQTSNKFLQTIIITNHSFAIKAVGSKRGTYIASPKELHPAQGCTSTFSLLGLFLRNQHIERLVPVCSCCSPATRV